MRRASVWRDGVMCHRWRSMGRCLSIGLAITRGSSAGRALIDRRNAFISMTSGDRNGIPEARDVIIGVRLCSSTPCFARVSPIGAMSIRRTGGPSL